MAVPVVVIVGRGRGSWWWEWRGGGGGRGRGAWRRRRRARRRRRLDRSTAAPMPTTSSARDEVEPRVERLGQHVGGEREGDGAEREDARGVGDGDDGAERDGLARRPARPDEVGRHHRLPVPGRERVHGAPAEGGQEQEHEDAAAGRGVAEDGGEPVVGALRAAAGDPALAVGAPTACRRPGARRSGPPARRPGCRARPAGSAGARGSGRRPARSRAPRCRGPAGRRSPSSRRGPANVPSRTHHPARIAHRAPRGGSPRAWSSARPARADGSSVARPAGRSATRRPSTVSTRCRRTSARLRASSSRVGQPALLEGGDLRLVEDVAQLDAVGGHRHLREVVDGEVAERVGLRGRRQRAGEAGEDQRRAGIWACRLLGSGDDHQCAPARRAVLRLDATGSQQAARRLRAAGHRRQDHEHVGLADGRVQPAEDADVLVVQVDVHVAVERAVRAEELRLGVRMLLGERRAGRRRRRRRPPSPPSRRPRRSAGRVGS